MECPTCKINNELEAKFCYNCGTILLNAGLETNIGTENNTTSPKPNKSGIKQMNSNTKDMLTKIAMNVDDDRDIRILAMESLKNEDVFYKIATNVKDNVELRKMAMQRLTDQEVLARIAGNDGDDITLRKLAIKCLSQI